MTDEEEQAMWVEALSMRELPVEPVPSEVVWRAVAGELGPAEMEPLIDRLAWDPDLQVAWRLARELRERRVGVRRFGWAPLVLLAACVLAWFALPVPDGALRGGNAVTSALQRDAGLARDAFVVEWRVGTPGPYRVRVFSERFEVLATSEFLEAPRWTVPSSAFDGLQPGASVYWQVESPGVTSALFRQTLAR